METDRPRLTFYRMVSCWLLSIWSKTLIHKEKLDHFLLLASLNDLLEVSAVKEQSHTMCHSTFLGLYSIIRAYSDDSQLVQSMYTVKSKCMCLGLGNLTCDGFACGNRLCSCSCLSLQPWINVRKKHLKKQWQKGFRRGALNRAYSNTADLRGPEAISVKEKASWVVMLQNAAVEKKERIWNLLLLKEEIPKVYLGKQQLEPVFPLSGASRAGGVCSPGWEENSELFRTAVICLVDVKDRANSAKVTESSCVLRDWSCF